MKNESGQNVSLQLEELNNQFGDRTIVWMPQSIDTNIAEDTKYTVSLEDVNIDNELRDYTYEVILFDPEN